MSHIEVMLAGETVQLHAGRGLHWPRERLLAIADLHLGKGDAFRRGGLPLPRGGTAADLERLDRMLSDLQPATLLVLGDLLHGAVHADAAWLQAWRAWRRRHASLAVRAVRGNHDRAFDPARLDVDDAGEAWHCGPFAFVHDVDAVHREHEGRHALGGHLHPVARLRDLGLSARLPAFWLGQQRSVLPAFTAFSGGVEVNPAPGDRLWLCADGAVVALPPRSIREGVRRSPRYGA